MARRNVVLAFRCSKDLFDYTIVYHWSAHSNIDSVQLLECTFASYKVQ